MATGTNWASLMSGRNPSGTNLTSADYSIAGGGVGSSSGANPIIAPANLPQSAPQTNPYAPGSVTPTPVPSFPANQGPYQTTPLTSSSPVPTSFSSAQSGPLGAIFSGETPKGFQQLFSSLSKTMGPGIGNLIANFLSSGAGFNQDAINNLFAALQPGITQGTESIMDQFSALGDRFGSDASIGLSNFESQVNLNEGQIESQMYEQSINDFINVMMGAGTATANRQANKPSTWDTIGNITNLVGSAAGGASAAGVGGSAGSILDTIASLAGAL